MALDTTDQDLLMQITRHRQPVGTVSPARKNIEEGECLHRLKRLEKAGIVRFSAEGKRVGIGNFVFVAVGTGIGSGIFIDHKLYRGRTGSAGEIYLMNVDWRRWNEDFNETGHVESFASGIGVAEQARQAGLLKRSAKTTELDDRDSRRVFAAMRRGNRLAAKVVDEVFTVLGVAVANMISTAIAAAFTIWAKLEAVITAVSVLAGYLTYALIAISALAGRNASIPTADGRSKPLVPRWLSILAVLWLLIFVGFLTISRSNWTSVNASAVSVAVGIVFFVWTRRTRRAPGTDSGTAEAVSILVESRGDK